LITSVKDFAEEKRAQGLCNELCQNGLNNPAGFAKQMLSSTNSHLQPVLLYMRWDGDYSSDNFTIYRYEKRNSSYKTL